MTIAYGQLWSQLIPRGSGRLGLPYAGTNRHPVSFIPKAIKMYNDNVIRLNWEDSLIYHCYVLYCVTKLLIYATCVSA